jgi:DNA-binding CsgD family transcriptional regulator
VEHLVAPRLSAREVEVLLTWLGTDSKEEAAKTLYLSAATVSTHLSRIRNKYAAVGRPAGSKTKLLVRAIQDGITTIDAW